MVEEHRQQNAVLITKIVGVDIDLGAPEGGVENAWQQEEPRRGDRRHSQRGTYWRRSSSRRRGRATQCLGSESTSKRIFGQRGAPAEPEFSAKQTAISNATK